MFIPFGFYQGATEDGVTPLLDLYGTNAIAAYSMRLLSSTYAGDCLQVERSSDSATQDIGFVDGYLDTAAMLSFIGVHDGRVSIWYDQSGEGKDLDVGLYTLPLIVNAGTLVTNPDNSKAGLYSDTNLVQLRTTNKITELQTSGGTFTTANVWRLENRTGDPAAMIYNLDNSSERLLQYRMDTQTTNQDSIRPVIFGNSPFLNAPYFTGPPLQQTVLSSFLRGSTTAKTYLDGVEKVNVTQTARTGQDPRLEIFARENPTGTDNESFTGYIQEFILWDADEATDLSDIEDNINEYWEIYSTSYDTDAQAFFTAVEGGGDVLTTTEKDAVNQLVVDLKADSIWSDILYAYPFVGGTATAHKWNLKDPQDTDAAYRLDFGSVVAHNSSGILGTSNDPNSYGDTHYNPTAAGATGHTIALYINQGLTATPANEYDYGAFQSPNDNMISFGFNNKTTKFVCFDATSYKTSTGGTYTNSVFAGSNDGTNSSIYFNGTSLITSAQNFDPVNINYYLLASNRPGTCITSETGRGMGMAIAYSIGLNGTQHSDLSDAITTCVTSLGRN